MQGWAEGVPGRPPWVPLPRTLPAGVPAGGMVLKGACGLGMSGLTWPSAWALPRRLRGGSPCPRGAPAHSGTRAAPDGGLGKAGGWGPQPWPEPREGEHTVGLQGDGPSDLGTSREAGAPTGHPGRLPPDTAIPRAWVQPTVGSSRLQNGPGGAVPQRSPATGTGCGIKPQAFLSHGPRSIPLP